MKHSMAGPNIWNRDMGLPGAGPTAALVGICGLADIRHDQSSQPGLASRYKASIVQIGSYSSMPSVT
jgi:hypothetical protein